MDTPARLGYHEAEVTARAIWPNRRLVNDSATERVFVGEAFTVPVTWEVLGYWTVGMLRGAVRAHVEEFAYRDIERAGSDGAAGGTDVPAEDALAP